MENYPIIDISDVHLPNFHWFNWRKLNNGEIVCSAYYSCKVGEVFLEHRHLEDQHHPDESALHYQTWKRNLPWDDYKMDQETLQFESCQNAQLFNIFIEMGKEKGVLEIIGHSTAGEFLKVLL